MQHSHISTQQVAPIGHRTDQKIMDVGQPGNANDAVTKSYVDTTFAKKSTLVNGFVPYSGGTISGPLNLGNKELFGVNTPTADKSAANKKVR